MQTVRTAFEMPVAPTPSPREIARARDARTYDSLSKALSQLNSETVRQIWGSTPTNTRPGVRQPLQPSPFAVQPALSLLGDLNRGTLVPASPSPVSVLLPIANGGSGSSLTQLGGNTTFTLPARRLFSSRLTGIGAGISDSAESFLEAWAARESLRRADEELLGRRILEDRIELQVRSDLPQLDLSLVPPETQLELTNLRLKLIPLLQIPREKRAQAAAEIEAIEARLNQIWEQETARQAALLNQTLVVVPARLRQEGEAVLAEQRKQSAAQTEARIAQVRRDLETRLQLRGAPPLSLGQQAATSPNSVSVRAQLNAPLGISPSSPPTNPLPVSEGHNDIANRGTNPSSQVPRAVAAKNERIWREATR